MNFALTEEQVMIRDAAQDFLAETCGSEAVRAAAEQPRGFDPAVWTSIARELGWCGLTVPEAHGGLGLGPVELMLVQEQAGYHLLPAPFFASACVAATLLVECADAETQAALLPAIAAGESLVVGAHNRARRSADRARLCAPTAGAAGDWVLNGALDRVPNADVAQQVVFASDVQGESALFVLAVDQPGIAIASLDTWDTTRRQCQLELRDARARRCDGPDLQAAMLRADSLIRLYLAAEQLGAAQRCLDMTVAYVQERKQFGRAIGSFQAVKHRCAQMMVAVENARSMVYGAAALAAGTPARDELEMDCASARITATEALQFCAAEAIQLHGGVGFTLEYDPQLYFKRAQASAHMLGEPSVLRARIAAQLLDAPAAEA